MECHRVEDWMNLRRVSIRIKRFLKNEDVNSDDVMRILKGEKVFYQNGDGKEFYRDFEWLERCIKEEKYDEKGILSYEEFQREREELIKKINVSD